MDRAVRWYRSARRHRIGKAHALHVITHSDPTPIAATDEFDARLPVGQTGQILVRPQRPFTTFLGYDGMPEETLETLRNCWIHTGDAGYFDADGYLHFVDRIKDVIRRRGENISSFQVESVVAAYPGVADCAAIAVPSGRGVHDDEVYVAVVAEAGPVLGKPYRKRDLANRVRQVLDGETLAASPLMKA